MDDTETDWTPVTETTVFGINDDGSGPKRRRRKSSGRRVSFAEAPSLQKVHIFCRDDDYETPPRGDADGASSPAGGVRRSPRLASKRQPLSSDDKENQPLILSPEAKVGKRKGRRPLGILSDAVVAPVSKPADWLDERDASSVAMSGNEENSGPVDLRHLSFVHKDEEMDDDNLTLDSTTFAFKMSHEFHKKMVSVVALKSTAEKGAIPMTKNSAAVSSSEVNDLISPDNDMSLTRIGPVNRPKFAVQTQSNGEICCDMSITMQVSRRKQHSLHGTETIHMSASSLSVTSLGREDFSIGEGIPAPREIANEEEKDAATETKIEDSTGMEGLKHPEVLSESSFVVMNDSPIIGVTQTRTSASTKTSPGREGLSISGIPSLGDLAREEGKVAGTQMKDEVCTGELRETQLQSTPTGDSDMNINDSLFPRIQQKRASENPAASPGRENVSLTRGTHTLRDCGRDEEKDAGTEVKDAVCAGVQRVTQPQDPTEDSDMEITASASLGTQQTRETACAAEDADTSTLASHDREDLSIARGIPPLQDIMLEDEEDAGTCTETKIDVLTEIQGAIESEYPAEDSDMELNTTTWAIQHTRQSGNAAEDVVERRMLASPCLEDLNLTRGITTLRGTVQEKERDAGDEAMLEVLKEMKGSIQSEDPTGHSDLETNAKTLIEILQIRQHGNEAEDVDTSRTHVSPSLEDRSITRGIPTMKDILRTDVGTETTIEVTEMQIASATQSDDPKWDSDVEMSHTTFSGIQHNLREHSNVPRSAIMEMATMSLTRRDRRSQSTPDSADMKIVGLGFTATKSLKETHQRPTTDLQELSGRDGEVQAMKKLKLLTYSSSPKGVVPKIGTITSPFVDKLMAQGSITAQVPKLSELLAVDIDSLAVEEFGKSPSDMDIVEDTDYRTTIQLRQPTAIAASTDSEEIKSHAASELYQPQVSLGSKERNAQTHILAEGCREDNERVIVSMAGTMDRSQILNNKYHSPTSPRQLLQTGERNYVLGGVSLTGETEPADIAGNFENKPIVSTREVIDLTDTPRAAQKEGIEQGPHMCSQPEAVSGLIIFNKNNHKVESLLTKEKRAANHILSTSVQKKNGQVAVIGQSSDLGILDKRERVHPAQSLYTIQQGDQEPDTLQSLKQDSFHLAETLEENSKQQASALRATVKPSQIVTVDGKENKQDTLRSPRERVVASIIEASECKVVDGREADTQIGSKVILTSLMEERVAPSFLKLAEINVVHPRQEVMTPQVGSQPEQGEPGFLNGTNQGSIALLGGQESFEVKKVSVEEFFKLAEVQLSLHPPAPLKLDEDPSLAANYKLSSLIEVFNFAAIIQPETLVLRQACEELDIENESQSTSNTMLEQQLTAFNPALFSAFQIAPESEKQKMKRQLQVNHSNCRLLGRMKMFESERKLEMSIRSNLQISRNDMQDMWQNVKEQRTSSEDLHRQLDNVERVLSSKAERIQSLLKAVAKPPNVNRAFRMEVVINRTEDLNGKTKRLESAMQLKMAQLKTKKQVCEDNLRSLKQRLEVSQKRLEKSRNQAVGIICDGHGNFVKEEVAARPLQFAKKLWNKVCLLEKLQDGFLLKSAGFENTDLVVELGYRNLFKRRYVVRKDGKNINVISHSWLWEAERIDTVFPGVNASRALHYALSTCKQSRIPRPSNLPAQRRHTILDRLYAMEAARFVLPTTGNVRIPEPTDLRPSLQVTRILVGNLMNLMTEVVKCQWMVNTSCPGGGVIAEPLFRIDSDSPPRLEIKFIDCVSWIKFSIVLDMSCLKGSGYPLGDLAVEGEVSLAGRPVRHLFTNETLKQTLSSVKPGYSRLLRTFAAVGSALGSVRKK